MIRIKNIYYMLAYAFKVLRNQTYRNVELEEFDNATELYAAILIQGVQSLIKQGLGREYVSATGSLSMLRGKIEITESLKQLSFLRNQLVCTYDDFSVDTEPNQIIKATCLMLLHADISETRKDKIKKLLPYFSDVTDADLTTINWHKRYNRINQTYIMLVNICMLIYKNQIQNPDNGRTKLMDFEDEKSMSHLYEKFILEYYRQEHPEVEARASYIKWALDDEYSDMLPAMKSDVTITRDNKVLIIDAKYYGTSRQSENSNRSDNLYQIFTYVKNKAKEQNKSYSEISGMLLYAGTDEANQPNEDYRMSGNKISVKTLNLDRPFARISAQLDAIAEQYFG